MLILKFQVQNQIITRMDDYVVVSDSLNYLKANFSFSEDWAGMPITAVFRFGTETPYNVLLKDNACNVPCEVLNAGAFSVSVFAGNRITANTVLVNVIKSGYVAGQTPPEPTPDVYSEIIGMMEQQKVDAQAALTASDTARLKAGEAADSATAAAQSATNIKTSETAAAQSETNAKLSEANIEKLAINMIRQEDIGHIRSRIHLDAGLKIAILGDSTEAGRGNRNTDYGELGDKTIPTAQEKFALNLMFSSPYFLPFDASKGTVYPPGVSNPKSSMTSFWWNNLQLIYSDQPSMTYTYKHRKLKRDKLTIVYLTRYSSVAPPFNVICNGVTTVVNTYKAPQSFGSVPGQTQAGWDIAYREIDIPISGDTFSFTLQSTTAEAAAVIIGFYYGRTVGFKNLAVSTSTLMNNSSYNQSRGITTDDRLTAAFNYGADVFMIGWGSNDCRPNGQSVAAYKADLEARIDVIRTNNPDAVIILNSDVTGSAGSEFETNYLYFAAMKQVAIDKQCSFFDVNALLSTFERSYYMADSIHQNQAGYDIMACSLNEIFCIDDYQKLLNTWSRESVSGGTSTVAALRYFEYDIISRLREIVTPANILRLSFFDAESGTTIKDRSGNAKDITLSCDAASLSPKGAGVLKTLTMGAANTWSYANSDDLSFGDGAGNDTAFSVVWYGKPNLSDINGYLVSKRDNTSGNVQAEWQLFINGDSVNKQLSFVVLKQNASAYTGRFTSTSSTLYTSGYYTAVGTYDGSKAASGIKVYQNGVRVDSADFILGTYSGMTPGTAPVGNFRFSGTNRTNVGSGGVGFAAIIKEELTAAQVAEIDRLLRSAFGDDSVV